MRHAETVCISFVVLLCVAFTHIGLSSSIQAQQQAAPNYADVAAVFNQHCVMCHAGPRPAYGLRLDSYENTMAGSRNGRMVVPGSPEKSELLKRIRGSSRPRMPMNGPPWLSDNDAKLIENWIAAGALPDAAAGSSLHPFSPAPSRTAATAALPGPQPNTVSLPSDKHLM